MTCCNRAATAEDLGVSLVDFRVKQVEFMDEVRNSVYKQMARERARIAADRRLTGRAAARTIALGADRTYGHSRECLSRWADNSW